ncbi:MAG TPA: hypothetical protein VL978_14690, partial [Puia sp.]|nr:hypothetical protein [Puia sp.]
LSTHYFLLISEKTTLLVDAGWPGTIGKFLHLLRSTDIRPETITPRPNSRPVPTLTPQSQLLSRSNPDPAIPTPVPFQP